MTKKNEIVNIDPTNDQFLVYEAEDGNVKISVKMQDETVWLTQQMIADLFQSSKQNVGQHIKTIYDENELSQGATVKKFFTVQKEGDRDVKRNLDYYNLDVIISVGYRVKSPQGTKFRQWATKRIA